MTTNQIAKVELLEEPRYYLALTALFRDEARFLKEWIEFYRLMGVEHFYLFNHLSTDDYMEVLKPYIEAGIVDLEHLTYRPSNSNEWYTLQCATYKMICNAVKDQVEWLIIVDTDEFLYPVHGGNVTEALKNYDDYASVSVNWRIFGSNNVKRIEDNELLIQKLFKRDNVLDLQVKTIVKPRYVQGFSEPHFALMKDEYLQVTENYEEFRGSFSPIASYNIFIINHYSNRDEDFFYSRKISRVHMVEPNISEEQKALKIKTLVQNNQQYSSIYDDGILKFASALRAKLFNQPDALTNSSNIIDLPHNKKIYSLPNNLVFSRDSESDSYSLKNGYGVDPYLTRKIMAFVIPGETYVEINSGYGEISLQMSNKLGIHGKVYSFEPDHNIFQYTKANIFLNNISNIVLEHSMNNLDLYFQESKPDIIRINSAGNECSILEGGQNIIDYSNKLRIFIKWQSSEIYCLEYLTDKKFVLIDIAKFNEECSFMQYQQNYRLSIDDVKYNDEILAIKEEVFQEYREIYFDKPECITASNVVMFNAAVRGEIEEVRHALIHGANVNYYDEGAKCSALYYAVNLNNAAMVSFLLEQGADVELGYYRQVSPLWQAAKLGHYEIVKLLLSYGANKDFLFFGITPAKIAGDAEYTEVAKLLLGEDNQNNEKIMKENKTLHFTADWFTPNVPIWDNYKQFFYNKPNMHCLEIGSFEGRSTIYTAENYCNGEESYIDALDTWGGSIEHQDFHKDGLYERFVSNLKVHIDSQRVHIYRDYSSSTLMKFVQEVRDGARDKYDFVYIDASHVAKDVLMDTVLSWELLKIKGVMIFDDYMWYEHYKVDSMDSMTPKPAIDGFLASYAGMYQLLYKEGQVHILKTSDHPRVNELLYEAFRSNNVDDVKSALTKGAYINHIQSAGGTTLYWAAQEGKYDIAKVLLDAGANPEIGASNTMTPLTMSVQNNDLPMTKLLVESGAVLENPNGLGSTALYLASYFGYDEILWFLIENGANKNAQVQGVSAFQAALQKEHPSTAKIIAGSKENFCQEIQGTDYATKYTELCGDNGLSEII